MDTGGSSKEGLQLALGDKDVGIFASFFICIATKLCINLYTSKDFREKLQHFFAWRFLMGRFAIQKGLEGIVTFLYAPTL